jgi:dephospho-CoA kinase
MKNILVIGLIGEKGSGKETFAQEFQKLVKKKVSHVRFSDLLKETLELWSLPATRTHLQDLAVIMDQHFGEGTLANAIYERIQKSNAQIVIIDGIRWDADIVLLNRFEKHFLIYVTADLETRFQRIQNRAEKIGEGKSFEQFVKEEGAKNELSIPRLGANADIIIENNQQLAEFKQKINTIVKELNL